jgi:hypothetical protein
VSTARDLDDRVWHRGLGPPSEKGSGSEAVDEAEIAHDVELIRALEKMCGARNCEAADDPLTSASYRT